MTPLTPNCWERPIIYKRQSGKPGGWACFRLGGGPQSYTVPLQDKHWASSPLRVKPWLKPPPHRPVSPAPLWHSFNKTITSPLVLRSQTPDTVSCLRWPTLNRGTVPLLLWISVVLPADALRARHYSQRLSHFISNATNKLFKAINTGMNITPY